FLPSGTYPLTIQSVINATRNCGPTVCNIFYPTGTQNATMTVIRPSGLWTGEVDRDWFKAFNWGNCQVPDCAVDVVIPDTLNEPLILGGTASCRDITIQSQSSLEIGATGVLDICRDYTLETNAQLIARDGSLMRFVGSTDQRYVRKGTGNPWNVEIAQAIAGRRVILLDELVVQGTLTLTMGVIDGFAYDKETFTTRPSASALNQGHIESYISGVLRRNINTTAQDDWYHLPVGHLPSGKGYQLAQVRFNSTSTVSQLLSYFVPSVVTHPVTQNDCGASFGTLPNLNNGYWVIRRTGGTATSYHLRVYAREYTNASGHPEGYTIVKRPDGFGGNMGFEGICEGSPFNRPNQTGRRDLNDFSEFGVAQSPTPLSVQFIRVHAVPQSSAILLSFHVRQNWNQLLYHEIERSEDGIRWQKVAELPRETYLHREGDVGSYRWQDNYVQRSQSYFYRIRAVESTGNTFLSPVVEATLPAVGEFWAQIVPNPSQQEAWLETSEAGHSVRVWDAMGKLVWESTSADRIALPSDKLSAGVYVVEVGELRLRWVKQ
ncbi:MAG: T9SS type A sorting domain-containing protein, partial [Bacteroidia bacterium]|nr:T9SS type A sorting domain-containing protein [Bacteroidia bacterium]